MAGGANHDRPTGSLSVDLAFVWFYDVKDYVSGKSMHELLSSFVCLHSRQHFPFRILSLVLSFFTVYTVFLFGLNKKNEACMLIRQWKKYCIDCFIYSLVIRAYELACTVLFSVSFSSDRWMRLEIHRSRGRRLWLCPVTCYPLPAAVTPDKSTSRSFPRSSPRGPAGRGDTTAPLIYAFDVFFC